jgi:hypothetical protein
MKYTSEENEQLTDMIEDAGVETSCLKFIEESILAFGCWIGGKETGIFVGY